MKLLRQEKDERIEHNIIKDIRNLFRLKQEFKDTKQK